MKSYFLLPLLITFLMVACSKIDSEDISQKEIFTDYKVMYDVKSDEVVSGSAWKMMKEFRQFDVNTHKEFIKQFQTESSMRNEELMLSDLRNKWLWFAKNVPIWSERIAEYGGKVNKQCTEICFQDENKEEMFYEKYNLEPDEQSLDCQMKSILSLNTDDVVGEYVF